MSYKPPSTVPEAGVEGLPGSVPTRGYGWATLAGYRPTMARKKARTSSRRRRSSGTHPNRSVRPASGPRFVGRDPSPVLDKYPPKEPQLRGPIRTPTASGASRPPLASSAPSPASSSAATPLAPSAPTASSAPAPGLPASDLIRLDRAFDPDEFSQLLGETTVRIRVPRDSLDEVLRRVTEFMGFGVYVYSISVRPSDSPSLKEFEVELQRVDFSTERGRWEPFVERGAVEGG